MTYSTKIRLIESFIAMDYIYFGRPFSKVTIDEDCKVCKDTLVNDYITTKAALLRVMKEMYKIVDYQPKTLHEDIDENLLRKMSKSLSRTVIEDSKEIIKEDSIKKIIKKKLTKCLQEGQEFDTNNIIKERALMIATDVLFLTSIVNECKNFKNLNSWIGRVIEDSYKMLKESLVKTVMEIHSKRT